MIRSRGKNSRLLFVALFSVLFLAFGCRSQQRWHSYTLLAFDTVCDVKVYCTPGELSATQDEIRRIFTSIEEHFSPGREDYDSPIVIELYHKALKVYHDSFGSFDLTVGPLLELWGFSSGNYRLPRPEEIQATLPLVDMKKIRFENDKISLDPRMKLDWGGIAKGWAVDLAFKALVKMGVQNGFINAGGDLYCWGYNPDRAQWRIGIKNPRKGGFLGVIIASNCGVATSGDYQRYFERNGRRYHHLFNPKTGYPARGKTSVTVVGPETAVCDALATALFVSPEPESIILKYPDYGALLVDEGGRLIRIGKLFLFEPFEEK